MDLFWARARPGASGMRRSRDPIPLLIARNSSHNSVDHSTALLTSAKV